MSAFLAQICTLFVPRKWDLNLYDLFSIETETVVWSMIGKHNTQKILFNFTK